MEANGKVVITVDVSQPKLEKEFQELLRLMDGMRVIWAETDGGDYAFLKGEKGEGEDKRRVVMEVKDRDNDPYVYVSIWNPDKGKEYEWRTYLPVCLWDKIHSIISSIEDEITARTNKKYETVKVEFE